MSKREGVLGAVLLGLCAVMVHSAVSRANVLNADARAVSQELRAGAPFNKVFIVIFENEAEEEALKYPFFRDFAQHGALLSNYHAITHPSYPNYLALTAGTTFNIHTDFQRTIDATHLGDLLEAKGRTWRVYAEDYPGGRGDCRLESTRGRYARRHVPFLSYRNVQESSRCDNIVAASQLPEDIANGTLADYSLFIPNVDDDGHDTNLEYADHWFAETFRPLLQDPKFTQGLLLVVTFDEDDNHHHNNIYTALWGPGVAAGSGSSAPYNHYDLLRTIEDGFGLGTLGRSDEAAQRIDGIWAPGRVATGAGK